MITKFSLTPLTKSNTVTWYWLCERCCNVFKAETDGQQVKELEWNHCPKCGRAIVRVDTSGVTPCHTK